MSSRNHNIRAFVFFGAVFCLSATSHAAATVEIFSDNGFQINPPFAFDSAGFNATASDGAPPEGSTVLDLGIAGGAGGGCSGCGGGMGVGNNGNSNRSAYAGGRLIFWLKSSNPIIIEIEHSSPGTKSSANIPSTGGQWQEISLRFDGGGSAPYKFNNAVNLNNVIAMFLASNYFSPGQMNFKFDHIRWIKPVTSMAIFPQVTYVNPGSKRQFTFEGRDAAGDPVYLYAPFNTTSSAGTITPAPPSEVQAATFTANTANGNVNVTQFSITTSAVVNNTAADLNEEFGLFSESIPSVTFGLDSYLGTDQSGGSTITLGNSLDAREGNVSLVSTVNVQAGGYAGWFLQFGSSNTAADFTKDMNLYYEGALRFWFKGPATGITNDLEVSIRSSNVDPGEEYSKVKLSEYAAFDGNWHSVAIPIKAFAGARRWADISRIKILAAFFVVGNSNGSKAFYIDNLRWDTRKPGPLASLSVVPNPANIPLSANRIFVAKGVDANGVTVDIYPAWSMTGNIGSLSASQGQTTVLAAAGTPQSGSLTATQGAFSTTTLVNVADPVWTQSYNVYSDAGSGGYVGVAINFLSTMTISEKNLGAGAPEGANVRVATYTLINQGGQNNAFATWFTNYDSGSGSRYMGFYSDGYLYFWVKTNQDLQFSIRSSNIPAGTEKSKFRLSELGIPTNNVFQKVILSMADFKAKEPLLDFNQIQNYFTIGALSNQIGQVFNETFEVDDVKWLTAAGGVPDENKVYVGLQEKQQASGLVQSFSSLPQAVTYDQALAAMNFTYRLDFVRSQNVFNVYQAKYSAGGFSGFHDEYDMTSPNTILDSDRLAGPNAWMLLALLHYRNVAPSPQSTQYDAMIDGLAAWLLGLQDLDGAVKFGYVNNVLQNNKSTEHAFDCYAAFQAYAEIRNNPSFSTAANNVASWLSSEAYVPAQGRFNVGELSNGSPNTDKALDAYSWAPLAMSSYTPVLNTAVLDLGTTRLCNLTGLPVTGFDFSGPPGALPDKDAVWIEGTGQMALSYYFTGNQALGDFYMNQLDKAIVTVSQNGQGMPYATNGGTAYGFNMDSLNPCVPSAAWYLFAKKKFNPFRPSPLYGVQVKNIANNLNSSSVTWNASVPVHWVRANQYVQIDAQPVSVAPWGIQTYTNNTIASAVPKYVDPTPGNTINLDSNPAGLGWLRPGVSTTSLALPLAWRIQDSTSPSPSAVQPYTLLLGGEGEAFNWFYFKDRATPHIDANGNGVIGDPVDGTAFVDGEDYIMVRNPNGIHASQGSGGYVSGFSPDYLFLEASFGTAAAQESYQTNTLSLEFFLQ